MRETVPVALGAGLNGPQSGRILVFARKVQPGDEPSDGVDTSAFEPTGTAIAARETWSLAPGETATIDGDSDAFPTAWSKLPAAPIASRRCSIAITITITAGAGRAISSPRSSRRACPDRSRR